MKPKFGQWIEGIHAGDGNPIKYGMYVKTVIRTGKVNRGKFYELTNGKGKFWQYPIDAVKILDKNPLT